MTTIKLEKKIIYSGTITLKTGLHIGGTNAALNIGGPDKFVVRNPINNIPYIPGSSLKGKMRALIEISHRCVSIEDGKVGPSKDPMSISGRVFGVSAAVSNSNTKDENAESKRYASRLIVRDSELIYYTEQEYNILSEETKDMLSKCYNIKSKEDLVDFSNTDLPYTESKTEVAIDRVTSSANPRTFERVPAGAKFKLDMVLNIFEGDNEKELLSTVDQAFDLLRDDYLGGHGSRGYGQVEIEIVNKEIKTY